MRRALFLLVPLILPGQAMAETFSAGHAGFALKPRIDFSVRPVPLAPAAQRPARIYGIELGPSPVPAVDLHLSFQRKRQRFSALRATRSDDQPRSSIRLVDAGMDLPQMDDRMSASVGWQAVKISNKAVNVTSPFSSDDLRVRDDFVPSAQLAFVAAPGVLLAADYRETVRAYADIGTIGALGLDQPAFRALRNALRPEQDSRTRISLRWMVTPQLRLDLAAYGGQVQDRLAFIDNGYVPRNLGAAQVQGIALETRHAISSGLRWTLRYDRARIDPIDAAPLMEQRLAVGVDWHRGPWRCAMQAARTGAIAWVQGEKALRVEGGIDYQPADPRAPRIGLHLQHPDRLTGVRMAQMPMSGPLRAADQARALMLRAALRW